MHFSIGNKQEGATFKLSSGEQVVFGQKDTYWYRRGSLKIGSRPPDAASDGNAHRIHSALRMELSSIESYLDFYLSSSTSSIGRFEEQFTNRLTNLSIAKKCGLDIPETIVSNDVDQIVEFYHANHGQIVTKMIGSVPPQKYFELIGLEVSGGFGTHLLTNADMEKLKTSYRDVIPLPAFFQKYVSKKIEIRVFFLGSSLYPMAIFSQSNPRTRVDYRRQDRKQPNRLVPYKLPFPIERKILKTMEEAGLDCGSIDLILHPDDKYYFLEVNPIGQYQWLARNCNYDIDRAIAKRLLCNSKTYD